MEPTELENYDPDQQNQDQYQQEPEQEEVEQEKPRTWREVRRENMLGAQRHKAKTQRELKEIDDYEIDPDHTEQEDDVPEEINIKRKKVDPAKARIAEQKRIKLMEKKLAALEKAEAIRFNQLAQRPPPLKRQPQQQAPKAPEPPKSKASTSQDYMSMLGSSKMRY